MEIEEDRKESIEEMRALKFMKIDYIKTKQQIIVMPLFLLLITAIMMSPDSDVEGINAVIPFCYMIFMMTIFSSSPFGSCRKEETGFLQLLPATTWDRVTGRFLYGVSLIAVAIVFGLAAVGIYRILGFEVNAVDIPLCMIVLAVGILIITAEYIFFYLFGENTSVNLIGVVRTVPGMCFFFVTTNLSKEISKDPELASRIMQVVGKHLNMIGWISVAVSVAALIAATVLCAKVTDKKDC